VDFVIVRFRMKLFNTTNMDIINNCRQYLDVKLPSTLWSDRVRRFEKKFAEYDNIFLQKFQSQFDSLYLALKGKGKGKAEHLYSALHGIQTTLKRSGMDHTVLPAPCLHLPRKRSPDGTSTD